MTSTSTAAARGGGKVASSASTISVAIAAPHLTFDLIPVHRPPHIHAPANPPLTIPDPRIRAFSHSALAAVVGFGIGDIIVAAPRGSSSDMVPITIVVPGSPLSHPSSLFPQPLAPRPAPVPFPITTYVVGGTTGVTTSGDVLSLRGVRWLAWRAAAVRRCEVGGRRSGVA